MACGGNPPHKQLLLAVQTGDVEKALTLLSNKKKIPDFAFVDVQGRSCLHHAVRLEDTSVLQKILDACTIEDAVRDNPRNGRTPLMTASNFGKTEACSLLLIKMGDIQAAKAIAAADTNFCNSVHYAAGKGYADTIQMLLEKAQGEVQHLLASTDGGANTPLHKAATGGHSQVVRILIDHGANVKVENCDGMTPVQTAEAAMQGDWQTVVSILQGGNDTPGKMNPAGAMKSHSFRDENKTPTRK